MTSDESFIYGNSKGFFIFYKFEICKMLDNLQISKIALAKVESQN